VFEIETQEFDQWCWAAVAVSVERYLSNQIHNVKQCDLAGQVLGTTCCPGRVACNRAERLQTALKKIGQSPEISGPLNFPQVQKQIRDGYPIGVRIEWRNGSAHFVIIRGYRSAGGAQILNIADPWYDNTMQDYQKFCDDYMGMGTWTHSFLLQPRRKGSYGTRKYRAACRSAGRA